MKKFLAAFLAIIVVASILVSIAWVIVKYLRNPQAAQPTQIGPTIVYMSGQNFSATVRISTQEEKIMLGTWYLTPFKPPAENYIDIKTVDGKMLHVGRSQVREMISSAD